MNEIFVERILGLLADGKNHLVVVKTQTQSIPEPMQPIQARSVIRILWDPLNSQPVLFMEPVYGLNIRHWWAILEFCKTKARQLNVPLFTEFSNKDLLETLPSDENRLEALQGPATSWDMSDAVTYQGQRNKDKTFIIKHPLKVSLS